MPPEKENGFTLIEVLVSLVLVSLLLGIVMNTALLAKERTKNTALKSQALELAHDLVITRASEPHPLDPAQGQGGTLRWELREAPIATDPRGFFVLTNIEAIVRDGEGRTLSALSTRKLKALAP